MNGVPCTGYSTIKQSRMNGVRLFVYSFIRIFAGKSFKTRLTELYTWLMLAPSKTAGGEGAKQMYAYVVKA